VEDMYELKSKLIKNSFNIVNKIITGILILTEFFDSMDLTNRIMGYINSMAIIPAERTTVFVKDMVITPEK
jgi:hypothetical protein